MLQQATARVQTQFPDDVLVQAKLFAALAETYYRLGMIQEMANVCQKSYDVLREALPPEHPVLLQALGDVGAAHFASGRFDQAIPILEDTLRRKEKAGVDANSLLETMGNLALAYAAAGRLDEALPLHEETFRKATASLGCEHRGTLNYMGNLAEAYRQVKRLSQALSLRRRSVSAAAASARSG